MSLIEDIDYIDADVAYLLGLITARGKISEDSDPNSWDIAVLLDPHILF